MGGAVNHDLIKHRPEVDVAWDLNQLPWPWADNSFGLVIAKAVLEHLHINLVVSLNECWRILKPAGQVYIKVPYWKCEAGWDDPTHYWHFGLHFLEQFDPDTERGKVYGYYSPCKWRILKVQLNRGGQSILASLEVRK
jgi:SAM-dependent methyltransferase